MPEPTSKSVDLLTAKSAAQLLSTDLLYVADPVETDPDDFNRKVTIANLVTYLKAALPVKLNKLDATTAPTTGDDTGDGYAVGSIWINVTADTAYICADATLTAAVWLRLDNLAAGPLNKLDATTAPTTGDDTGDGYSVGSLWVNVTADTSYICVDATSTAAVWLRIDNTTGGLLNKLDATTAPTTGDDTGDGYAVGSLWVNVTADTSYICVDATSTAAVWLRIDNTTSGLLNKLDATTAPTTGDDTGDGYSVGSLWVNVTADTSYICVDATSTAAVWLRIDNTTSGPLNKLDATTAPTTGDDTGDGYSVGSLWVNVTADNAYICADATSTAAVWLRIDGGGDVVSDTTPQLGGPLDANGNQIQESLGTYSFASVTMTPNDDGNSYYFTDSGFTLTNIVIAPAGTEITIDFAAVGTITPGGNLVIDASNITVAASDVAKWLSNGTNWRLVSYKRFNGRALVTEVSEDTTPQAGGNFSMNAHMMQFSKGADIASATSLTLGSDGNSFDVTGTTTITSIGAKAVGTWTQLHFDGSLTLTNHATNLILPGGANITTAAGDMALLFEYAAGQYRVFYQRASGLPVVTSGNILKTVVKRHDPSAAQNGTTTYADLDGSSDSFTPISAASKILYRYTFYQANVAGSGVGSFILLLDGAEQTESKHSIFDSTPAIGEGYRTFEYLLDSWGTTSKTLKMQAREYLASNEVKWHATAYVDGAGSSVLVRAVLTITEIL